MKPTRNLIKEVVAEYSAYGDLRDKVASAQANQVHSAIPQLGEANLALLKLIDAQHSRKIREMLMVHHEMLNDEGPWTLAAKNFAKWTDVYHPVGENVSRTTDHFNVSPRTFYASRWPRANTVMESEDVENLFAACDVVGSRIDHWGDELKIFTGILPGKIFAKDEQGIVRQILDLFPINREGFLKLSSMGNDVKVFDHLGQYGGVVRTGSMVTSSKRGLVIEFNVDVHKEKSSTAANCMIQPKQAQDHWDVRTMFTVCMDHKGFGMFVKNTTWSLNHEEQLFARGLFHVYEVKETTGDTVNVIPLPDHYRKDRDLDHRVVVYNAVEDAYHFGTSGLIPPAEARESLCSYFERAGIFVKQPEQLTDAALGDAMRDILFNVLFKNFEKDGTITLVHPSKLSASRAHRHNLLKFTLTSENVAGKDIKIVTVFFALGHFENEELEPLQQRDVEWVNALNPGFHENYQFSFIHAPENEEPRGLMLVGDNRYTLRTKNTIFRAIVRHIKETINESMEQGETL